MRPSGSWSSHWSRGVEVLFNFFLEGGGGLSGDVTGIFNGSTQENVDGIATVCFHVRCPVMLFK